MKKLLCAVLFSLVVACQNSADLVILNGKVWTVEKTNPLAEAIAVKGNKILKVGFNSDIKKLAGRKTKIINAQGKLVLPGFNDAHLHFIGGALSLMNVDLNGCGTLGEIQQKIKKQANELPKGSWITGRGWDHTVFNNGQWPTKKDLDPVSPDHPVYVKRVDGHVGWANSKALILAQVDAHTQSPDGGEIVRDESGNPTGIFKESALGLVGKVIPATSKTQKLLAAEKALVLAKELGITSVQDNSGIESLKMYNNLLKHDKLSVRITEWMDFDLAGDADGLVETFQEFNKFTKPGFLSIGLLKGFVDGTLGSRTAYFFQPYDDDQSTVGLPQYDYNELIQKICTADSLGFQVGLHCIGPKANWMALKGFKEAAKRFGKKDSRHRLEHAQVFRLEDIPLLSELGVIASMQPTHCTSDKRWAEERMGQERSKGAYAWKRILDAGAKISFGTDWPVEPLDPMRGLYSAVTREGIKTPGPDGGWFPDQKLTMAKAIQLYTLDAAFGEFQENKKGSISPGKLADLIILSDDLFSIPPRHILDTKVDLTIFDGKIVYEREDNVGAKHPVQNKSSVSSTVPTETLRLLKMRGLERGVSSRAR
jgi:predicted amidohydrolase YtcJ